MPADLALDPVQTRDDSLLLGLVQHVAAFPCAWRPGVAGHYTSDRGRDRRRHQLTAAAGMNDHSFSGQRHPAPPVRAAPRRQARGDPPRRDRRLRGARVLHRPGRRRRPRRRRRRRHRLPLFQEQGRPARLDLRKDDARGDRRGPRLRGAVCATRSSSCRDDRARAPRAPRRATAASPSSFRWSCGSPRSSWSTSRRRCCASTSASSARRSRRRPAPRAISARDINATLAAKIFFGGLDEMATNWILSTRELFARCRRRTRSSTYSCTARRPRARSREATEMRCARLPCSAPGDGRADRRALRQCRRARAAAGRHAARRRATACSARVAAEAGSVLHARRRRADPHRRLRRGPRVDRRRRLDRRGDRRAARRQAGAARARRRGAARRTRSSARTRPAFRSRRSPRAAATASAVTGWARTSSIRRATCTCSS